MILPMRPHPIYQARVSCSGFKRIDFLVEFYEIEHLQSIDDAVDDLMVCCQNNGGPLRLLKNELMGCE